MSSAIATVEVKNTRALPCARCGYDLRVQPRDGICPECATPVEQAIELAAIPIRPAWRNSDPRWRRRMIAGAWFIALVLPLLATLNRLGLAERITIPAPQIVGPVTLAENLATDLWIYSSLVFCIGMVLFFAKERYRRRNRLDWTRRWGVFLSYIVLLLSMIFHGTIVALVGVGLGALFMSLPHENQPVFTGLLMELSGTYLRYVPDGASEASLPALAAFSAALVLLACAPIFTALRSTGRKLAAVLPVVPLAMAAIWRIAEAVHYHFFTAPAGDPPPPFFFQPDLLVRGVSGIASTGVFRRIPLYLVRELFMWLPFLVVAIWLSVAQVRSWRRAPAAE